MCPVLSRIKRRILLSFLFSNSIFSKMYKIIYICFFLFIFSYIFFFRSILIRLYHLSPITDYPIHVCAHIEAKVKIYYICMYIFVHVLRTYTSVRGLAKRILYLEPSACSVYLEIGIFLRYLKFHEKFIRVEHKRIYMYVPIHISNIHISNERFIVLSLEFRNHYKTLNNNFCYTN